MPEDRRAALSRDNEANDNCFRWRETNVPFVSTNPYLFSVALHCLETISKKLKYSIWIEEVNYCCRRIVLFKAVTLILKKCKRINGKNKNFKGLCRQNYLSYTISLSHTNATSFEHFNMTEFKSFEVNIKTNFGKLNIFDEHRT